MTTRLLYVFVVTTSPLASGERVPPALMVFGRLPDGHELHAYVLRESPASKNMAALMLRMWGDIPPNIVADLEAAARTNKRAYVHRTMEGIDASLCVVANPHYPEAHHG